MSGTFDEGGTGSESAGKRPAPTIEGTATEVSVEPNAEETKPSETKSAESETAALEAPDTGEDDSEPDEPEETDDSEADTGPEPQPVHAGEAHSQSFGSRLLAFTTTLFTHALAGLAGGLAVLAALVWGYLPVTAPQDESSLDTIQTRIAALESAPKTPDNAVALEGLKSRLATLESATGEAKAPAADPAEVEALAAQVAQMETSLKSLAEAAKDGGSVADAAAINQQVAEAEQRLGSELQSKIQSEVQSALASGEGAPSDDKSVQALKAEVSDLDAKLKALTAATMERDDESKVKREISALQRRLNEVEATLPSLEKAVDAENAQTRKANLAIAFSGLRDAVNSGGPYATELAAMRALAADGADLEPLADYENTGIPTVQMLDASFVSLQEKALAEQGDADQSFFGRLLGSAQSLVTVRRIGEEAEGSGPDAVLARADAKLEAGKLDEAVLEVETLDGSLAKIFGPWIDQALARLDADAALQQIQDALLVSLAGDNEASHGAGPPAADEETE